MPEDMSTPAGSEQNAGQEKSAKKQKAIFVIVAILIVLGLFFYLTFLFNKKPVSEPEGTKAPIVKEIGGDLTIPAGEIKTIENGDRLKVSGNLIVDGELNCSGGGLWIEVAGDAAINGRVACARSEDISEEEAAAGITLVVNGALNINEEAKLETNGHVQLIDNAGLLLITPEEFTAAYEEIAQDRGEGVRIGPFITKDKLATSSEETDSADDEVSLIKAANAADKDWTIGGELVIERLSGWKKPIVIIKISNARELIIKNFALQGPEGRDGQDDIDKSCMARGGGGQDALRLLVEAPELRIDNFELWLGRGGNGGEAATLKDCYPGLAYGGHGGRAGNFKLIAGTQINIVDEFTIHPGRGGNGGSAAAWGGNGESGKPGGDATAEGGHAENNEKLISSNSLINGMNFIIFDSMEGGNGGSASAFAGQGGDGIAGENRDGGSGGNARAVPGDGGDSVIILSERGAERTEGADDVGGNAGSVEVRGGSGGSGSQGASDKAGGRGGAGGDATFTVGHAGIGGETKGNPVKVIEDIAGAGGNGGDGCPPGAGGNGGAGLNPGLPGSSGRNLCAAE